MHRDKEINLMINKQNWNVFATKTPLQPFVLHQQPRKKQPETKIGSTVTEPVEVYYCDRLKKTEHDGGTTLLTTMPQTKRLNMSAVHAWKVWK